jgi:hypothetical protein
MGCLGHAAFNVDQSRMDRMEIQKLQVLVTDQDLNDLAAKHIPEGVAIEDLEIRILPEGIRVKGVYQVFVPVSFEALWEMGVDQGRVTARLANFRTLGMPTNVLKSLIMNLVGDAAKKEPWLKVEGDTVRADVDGFLTMQGLKMASRLSAINCEAGRLTVLGGAGQ